ncbi:chloride channel protein [Manganibacter manganicus]|uniref:Chloride channel protein n=1 Tax=Manganibacter manganicus TaxID=1873176 RepID=A0A1V8RVQ3_9HYPH|nr:chloride channel protein [Pseudaminobacter manganicus]OQM77194.1 chloride channel protein [Pseudaminobacter manganicus]
MAGALTRYPILRRSRALWGSRRVWRPRLVFWSGAVAVGVISVVFARLADVAQTGFHALVGNGTGWRSLLPLVMTPAGFVVCAWLAHIYFPNSQGSGIPQAIAARHLRDEEERVRLLSLKMIVGKIGLTLAGLLCGASISREGPTVQVGASVMLQVARWGGITQAKGLILAGSAAGVAAAFNTPLAGIVFAIEEMGRTYQARTNGLVLTAVIFAGLASLGLSGNYTYFGVSKETVSFSSQWPLILGCGVVGGAFGALFSLLVLKATRRIRRWNTLQPLKRTLIVAAACGLGVAIIGVACGGLTFGTGYDQARGAIEGTPLPWYFFVAKLAAGVLSTISGIPGGLFAPSLAVGAGVGSALGLLFGGSAGIAALLGMAGYFAGVVQAPMTAFVIILEMTGNHDNVIALMCASMLGYGTARLISREPLYHALSRIFIAESIRRRRAESDTAR